MHHGSGMHFGHYWSLSRSYGGPANSGNPKWIEFDDTKTRVVDDSEVQMYYVAPPESQNTPSWSSAYMLLYQS